jgi:predicted GNAT family N-acyltransferase
VEPLGPSHDRPGFHSGVPELDRYLHSQAGQDARRKVATPFVLVDGPAHILGYYTLSACSVEAAELPDAVARKLPRYPVLPATLLGRLAVSRAHRGQNLGRLLLIDALRRSLRNTSEVASVGVVVDALDESAHAFYLHYQFADLLDHANRLFLPMVTIDKAFKEP